MNNPNVPFLEGRGARVPANVTEALLAVISPLVWLEQDVFPHPLQHQQWLQRYG